MYAATTNILERLWSFEPHFQQPTNRQIYGYVGRSLDGTFGRCVEELDRHFLTVVAFPIREDLSAVEDEYNVPANALFDRLSTISRSAYCVSQGLTELDKNRAAGVSHRRLVMIRDDLRKGNRTIDHEIFHVLEQAVLTKDGVGKLLQLREEAEKEKGFVHRYQRRKEEFFAVAGEYATGTKRQQGKLKRRHKGLYDFVCRVIGGDKSLFKEDNGLTENDMWPFHPHHLNIITD